MIVLLKTVNLRNSVIIYHHIEIVYVKLFYIVIVYFHKVNVMLINMLLLLFWILYSILDLS